MKIVGLTGNIACGKSTVAGIFEDLGAEVIDADRIARSVVEPGEPAWKEIVREFGEKILKRDKTIDRKALGEIVFNDKDERERLNEITHPRILGRIREQIESHRTQNTEVVIIEAALIVEKGGLKNIIDELIVVTADREAQIRRLIARDGLSREEALSRIGSQMPLSEKIKHASYVVDNSGSLEDTRVQVEEIWQKVASFS